jgi:hypothetical protein
MRSTSKCRPTGWLLAAVGLTLCAAHAPVYAAQETSGARSSSDQAGTWVWWLQQHSGHGERGGVSGARLEVRSIGAVQERADATGSDSALQSFQRWCEALLGSPPLS